MSAPRHVSHDETVMEILKTDPDFANEYLAAALEEAELSSILRTSPRSCTGFQIWKRPRVARMLRLHRPERHPKMRIRQLVLLAAKRSENSEMFLLKKP